MKTGPTIAVSTLPLRIILKTRSLILPLGQPEDSLRYRQASKVYLCCPAPSKQIYQPEAQVLYNILEQGRDCFLVRLLDQICFRQKLAKVQCKTIFYLFVCFGRMFFQGTFIGQPDAFMWPPIKVSLHGVASKQFSFSMFLLCRGSGVCLRS